MELQNLLEVVSFLLLLFFVFNVLRLWITIVAGVNRQSWCVQFISVTKTYESQARFLCALSSLVSVPPREETGEELRLISRKQRLVNEPI